MMWQSTAFILAVAVGAPVFAQPSPAAPPAFVDRLRRALPAEEYVRRTAANDLFQQQSARLMLRSSRHPEIRRLAQAILSDHRRAATELRAAAAGADVRIDAKLSTVEFAQMLGKLTAASAENRDMLYLVQQRAVHERALAMHEDYANGGDQPALQEAAAGFAEIERGHLALLAMEDPAAPIPAASISPVP